MKGDWHDEQCKKAMMKDIFHELLSSARLAFHCNLLILFLVTLSSFVVVYLPGDFDRSTRTLPSRTSCSRRGQATRRGLHRTLLF